MRQGTEPDRLTVAAGQSVEFELVRPAGPDWSAANVGQFIVRGAGKQQHLASKIASGRSTMAHTFAESGTYLIALSVGPPEGKGRSDAWQQVTSCAKLVVRVFDESQPPIERLSPKADPGITAKVGQRFEIVPLISPASIKSGYDLPVRAFFDFEKFIDSPVTAVRPDGSVETRTTDSQGSTHFHIDQPGRWMIRLEKELEGMLRMAELVFDVSPAEPEQGERP